MDDDWARRAGLWVIGGALSTGLGAVAALFHPVACVVVGTVVAIAFGWNIERMIQKQRNIAWQQTKKSTNDSPKHVQYEKRPNGQKRHNWPNKPKR